jgi:hypothetical protein
MLKKSLNTIIYIRIVAPISLLLSSQVVAESGFDRWKHDQFCYGWMDRTEIKIHLMDRLYQNRDEVPGDCGNMDIASEQSDDNCIRDAGIVLVERKGNFRGPDVLVNAERYSLYRELEEIRFKGGRLAFEENPLDPIKDRDGILSSRKYAEADLELKGDAAESLGSNSVRVICQSLVIEDRD